jgi:tetratricopeptide (TPR) repeat protein
MRSVIIVILFFCCRGVNAQELIYEYVDSVTYAQFVAKYDVALQKTASKAFAQGLDFYYLRMRLGISYYNMRKYEKSIPHFKRAIEMVPADTLAQEYLYYAFVFTNRIVEANLMQEHMSQKMRERLALGDKKIKEFSIETGKSFNNNISSHKDALRNKDLVENKEYVYNGNIFYTKLFMTHKLGPRFEFLNAATIFRTNSLAMVNTPNGARPFEYANTHFQYNTGFAYGFNHGWKLSAGVGYYHISYTNIVPRQPMGLMHGPPEFNEEKSGSNYFSGGFTLAKRHKYFDPFIGSGYTNMFGTKQMQANAGLVIYPFGNVNFYMVGQASGIFTNASTHYVYSGKLGGAIGKKVFYECSAMFGNLQNYLASNGFNTFNSFDLIKMNLGIDLGFHLKKMNIIPSYRFQQKEGTISSTIPANNKTYTYNNQFLILTLQWKF